MELPFALRSVGARSCVSSMDKRGKMTRFMRIILFDETIYPCQVVHIVHEETFMPGATLTDIRISSVKVDSNIPH